MCHAVTDNMIYPDRRNQFVSCKMCGNMVELAETTTYSSMNEKPVEATHSEDCVCIMCVLVKKQLSRK